MKRLLSAGEQLVEAQRQALGGGGGPEPLREAMAAERDAVQELVGRAQELLREGERGTSGAMLDRLAETLRAAAVDPAGKEELVRGRVTREYERSGFDALGVLGGPVPRPGAPPASQQDELAERRHRRDEAQRRVRELRAAVRTATREAAAAEREADRAEREAAKARERADELQSEVERLEEELEEAEAEAKPRERR